MITKVLLGFAILIGSIPIAFAAPGDLCFETVDDLCGMLSGNFTAVFEGFRTPLETQVPGFSLIILWGGILAIIWFKTENIMLLGIVGVMVSATITGLSTEAQGIGMMMLGVSIGILLFQLIRQRAVIFS